MFDKRKKYWLYISPDVYYCMKNKEALLFHTITGTNIESKDPNIIELLELLHQKNNLGSVLCQGEMFEEDRYKTFILEFCTKKMGGCIEQTPLTQRPIQMMPLLNLQRDADRTSEEDNRSVAQNILKYLLQINLYLPSDCKQHCEVCNIGAKQTLCCTKHSNKQKEQQRLLEGIKTLLAQIRHASVGELNLLGGDVFSYPHLKELCLLLSDFGGDIHLWNHYKHLSKADQITKTFFYDVIVTSPIDKDKLQRCLSLLQHVQTTYHFYITNVDEYQTAEEIIELYNLDSYCVHPLYTGSNSDFFEAYIYMNQEDILDSRHSFREIFTHQKLNTHFFGSLTILPNGDVHANINTPSLGNIGQDDHILDIIKNEMELNTAWRKTRNETPCIDCLYQYLCPSPSNYELSIGKPNLCHIKK